MADSNNPILCPHVVLLPSAGMGHLTPFLRLAASLVDRHCLVTLITIQPTISNAESQLVSRFLATFPDQVREKQFHLLPFDSSTVNSTDPFWLRWEATRRSATHLSPLFSSLTSPPVSAVVYDVTLMTPLIPVITQLSLPSYVLFTSSARMFAFFASFPTVAQPKLYSGKLQPTDVLEIPSLPPLPVSMIAPILLNPESLFSAIVREDSPNIVKPTGILMNTFENLEPDSLAALNSGRVVAKLPPVHAIGPLFGDQKMNAEVAEKSGFGLWDRSWGWGVDTFVSGDQIGEKIKEMMESESLQRGAARVCGEARKAIAESGSRESSFKELINKWKN
ncbi:hypothetical protein ACFE04_025225 [Oxalis oulophora]